MKYADTSVARRHHGRWRAALLALGQSRVVVEACQQASGDEAQWFYMRSSLLLSLTAEPPRCPALPRRTAFPLGTCMLDVLHALFLRRGESADMRHRYGALLREASERTVGEVPRYLVDVFEQRSDGCTFSNRDLAHHRERLAACERDFAQVQAACRDEEQQYEFWNACCAGVLSYRDRRMSCLIGLPHGVLQRLAARRHLASAGTTRSLQRRLAACAAQANESPLSGLAAVLQSLTLRELHRLLLQRGRLRAPAKAAAVATLHDCYRETSCALLDPAPGSWRRGSIHEK